MRNRSTPLHIAPLLIGKSVRAASRLRGGGSALPGLVVEKLDPSFVEWALGRLPHGVVLVSGTNGKTTTTKIVVELLQSQGLKVFTNPSGSNFVRGVVAALVGRMSPTGSLDVDIAVLELDEAHAVRFVKLIKPRYSLLLNVMRDQLDRFGEIDTTARMLETIARATTGTVVINREDARLREIGSSLNDVSYFGLSDAVRQTFPSDDELYANADEAPRVALPEAGVILERAQDSDATFSIDEQNHTAHLALKGSYNLFNAAGALALARAVMGNSLQPDALLARLSSITPAFGRGETLTVDGLPCELVLIKNPGGFRLALSSFDPAGYATMIAINDAYADGRDVSWLWDVSCESLQHDGVAAVSGVRAYDMALRLTYDDVAFRILDPNLHKALPEFITRNAALPKRIYCTYTAMLAIRKQLTSYTSVERIGS